MKYLLAIFILAIVVAIFISAICSEIAIIKDTFRNHKKAQDIENSNTTDK